MVEKDKTISGPGKTERGNGLVTSFGPAARVGELQGELAEVELEQIEARQKLEGQILDAELDLAKSNAALQVAALKLFNAFHPQTKE